MSTKTSADIGELSRPSTRVHAPPGGGSSWNFGGDDLSMSAPPSGGSKLANSPPRKSGKGRGFHSPTKQTPVMSSTSSNNPPEVKRNAFTTEFTSEVSSKGSNNESLRIAVVKSSENEDLANEIVSNCLNQFTAESVSMIDRITVHSAQDFPFIFSRLNNKQQYDGIVLAGFIDSVKNPWANALAQSLSQCISTFSMNSNIPIVSAIYLGEENQAKSQIENGWGKEYVTSIIQLCSYAKTKPMTKPRVAHSPRKSSPKKEKSPISEKVVAQKVARAPLEVSHSLDLLRKSIKKHGARGIFGLARKFRIIDDDRNGTLCLDEFKKAISEHSLELTENEIFDLYRYFDDDNSGGITYDEFLVAIRGELNERRKQLVLMAFEVIDADKNGILEINDVIERYNADKHPDVISGKKTKNEVFREFLDTFDGGEKDGKVTPDEFIKYYGNVSASIDDDDYFELMIRNAWHISGGEGWCENSTCRRVLVTHDDGRQTVEEIKNDIGMKKDDKEAMRQNLSSQGIQAKNIDLTGSVEVESEQTPRRPQSGSRRRGAGESSIVFG